VKKQASPKKKSRWLRRLLVLLAISCAIAAAAGHVVFNVLPTKDPDKQFTRENIMSILTGETRVYYHDGKTLHGAFFDANHRVYVTYDQIPPSIVNALVAAEDARFFSHNGFDPKGFLRAVVANVTSMSWKQGGSTLTQQTAKNIFGREKRGLADKWEELQNALKLEKHFTKQEILEFYLNQFYVTGTGRGVSIAAWHFFSKDLSQLSLAECAFIAGSVKGPANYDPFNQKTQESRDKAIAKGQARITYVLGRMLEDGYISQVQHDEALKTPLQFQMGQFRFAQSTTMERIEEKLNGPFYQHLFDSLGIDTWQKSQLKIITTLDAQANDAGSRALQGNLADLQMKLGGFLLPKGVHADVVQRVRLGEYLYGSVDSVLRQGAKLDGIQVRFGMVRGLVSKAELDTFALRHKASPETALAKALVKGSVLLVRVLDTVPKQGMVSCRIETEPVVQGAMVALEEGQVIAALGGFHNTGYDRVNNAVRQFGSSWKPLLIALAIQNGWNYRDSIENQWNLFQLGRMYYFPNADHQDRAPRVSLAWAAARSENIASIWLLDHLLDHLTVDQLRNVAATNGYLAREGESNEDWSKRMRDSLGLVLNDETKAEINFVQTRNKVVAELRSEGQLDKAWALAQLPYGRGAIDGEKAQKKNLNNLTELRYNFLAMQKQLQDRQAAESRGEPLTSADSIIVRAPLTLADMMRLASALQPVPADADWWGDVALLFDWPDFRRQLAIQEFVRFAHEIGIQQKLQAVQSMPLGTNDVTLMELTVAYQSIFSGKSWRCADGEWNEPCLISEIRNAQGKVLFHNHTESRQVLADTTTEQMGVLLRETFESGTARGAVADLVVRGASPEQVLSLPCAGKTGTTNDYRNVAFMGALPKWDSSEVAFRLDHPITIGSYVGFDDNRSLSGNGLRIAGASGALPQWTDLALEMMNDRHYARRVDFLDLSLMATGMVPWYLPGRNGDISVSTMSGLPTSDPAATLTAMPLLTDAPHVEPDSSL